MADSSFLHAEGDRPMSEETGRQLVSAPPSALGPPIAALRRPAPPSRSPRPIDILYALRRRWKWALCLGLLAASVTVVVAWLAIPVNFTATALLRIAERKPRLVFDTSSADSLLSVRRAQATLITSNFVLNAALRQPGVAELDSTRDQKDQVAWLRNHLEVTFPGGAEFLQIAVTCGKAEDTVALTRAVKDAYMKEVVTVDRENAVRHKQALARTYQENSRTIEVQSDNYKKLANELASADSEFVRQKETHALQSLSEMRMQVNHLRGQYHGLEQKEAFLKERLKTIQPEGASGGTGQGTSLDRLAEIALRQNATMVGINSRLQVLEQTKVEQLLVVRGGEKSPAVRRIQDQIDLLLAEQKRRSEELLPQMREMVKEQMAQGLRSTSPSDAENVQATIDAVQLEKVVLAEELKTAEEEFDKAARDTDKLGTYSSVLEQRRAELERVKKINDRIGTELQQWEIELSVDGDRVVAMEEPALPKSSNLEKKQQQVLLAGLAAFVLAVLGVVSLDFVGYRVSSADELNQGLGVRVIGDLPQFDAARLGRGTSASELHGLIVESIDNIRTSLLHRARVEGLHVVMITSALAQEGKTTVSCQLAASLARSGRRTVLIDGDLRRPSAHRVFELPVGPGLAELLRDETTLEEVIRPTRAAGLWMLPAGYTNLETIQALAQGRLAEVIERLRQDFDFILIDSGPVLADSDAVLLGQFADGVLLSVRRDISRMPLVYEACERLRSVDLRILGAVMNGVSPSRYRPYYRPYQQPRSLEAETAPV